jgi:hypothetical protein
VRCRNIGSGYEKPDKKDGSCELDARVKEMMAARAAQDEKIWAPVTNANRSGHSPVPATPSLLREKIN